MMFRSFAIRIGFSVEFGGRDSCSSGECAEEVWGMIRESHCILKQIADIALYTLSSTAVASYALVDINICIGLNHKIIVL